MYRLYKEERKRSSQHRGGSEEDVEQGDERDDRKDFDSDNESSPNDGTEDRKIDAETAKLHGFVEDGSLPDNQEGVEVGPVLATDPEAASVPDAARRADRNYVSRIVPGAFVVNGIDDSDDDDDDDEGSEAPQDSSTHVITTAHAVDKDKENQLVQQRIDQALKDERDKAAFAQVVDHNGKFRRVRLLLVALIVVVIAAVAIVVPVLLTRKTDDLADGCTRAPGSGTVLCARENYIEDGVDAIFLRCPATIDDVHQCESCTIALQDGTFCGKCTVCSDTLAYDCSNVLEGDCTVRDCDGDCASDSEVPSPMTPPPTSVPDTPISPTVGPPLPSPTTVMPPTQQGTFSPTLLPLPPPPPPPPAPAPQPTSGPSGSDQECPNEEASLASCISSGLSETEATACIDCVLQELEMLPAIETCRDAVREICAAVGICACGTCDDEIVDLIDCSNGFSEAGCPLSCDGAAPLPPTVAPTPSDTASQCIPSGDVCSNENLCCSQQGCEMVDISGYQLLLCR